MDQKETVLGMISFIVPVYNVPERFLAKCINSIINQTYSNIEIIIVDDGSTDDSAQICDEFQQRDNRIKVIHQKNTGLSGARNTGFFKTRGEYISFVDGDDWIEQNYCEKMIKFSGYDVIISKIIKDYGKEQKYLEYEFFEKQVFDSTNQVFLQSKILDFKANISGVYAKLIRRDFLSRHNIIHDVMLKQGAEGIEYNFRLFGSVESVIFIDDYFYHYMYNDNSISAYPSETSNKLTIRCFEQILQSIQSASYEEIDRNKLEQSLYTRLLYFVITTAISSYFHPKNTISYRKKKQSMEDLLKTPLIADALKYGQVTGLGRKRKIILVLIKLKFYFLINALGIVRYTQKKVKDV